MSAIDITARGLAQKALDLDAEINEGAVSIATRSEPTAAALESLTADFAALTGYAGQTHTVETAPYLKRDGLVIRGNGAELRNVSTTPLATDELASVVFPVGTSNVWYTDALTYFPIVSENGNVLTVASGDGTSFSPGDLVVVHGATKYYFSNGDYNLYLNYTRARVIAANDTTITLDRDLPAELIADTPVIGNVASGPADFYLLYAPHVSNITLASDLGETLQGGGIIDGTFRDIRMEGRNAVALDAVQDCLFENIRFRSWRKICELAEGSYGTTVRGLRGTLEDSASRDPLAEVFFIAIHESSAECAIEDFRVSAGPNIVSSGGGAVLLGTGRNNEIRNGTLHLPSHTGLGLVLTALDANNPSVDCGYRNVTVYQPVASNFLFCAGDGAGLIRPYAENCRFFGSATVRAAYLAGECGTLENCYFEHGAIEFGTCTDWSITGNYISGGFNGLTPEILMANPGIRDNDSDAMRRLNAAAVLVEGTSQTIGATAANTPWQSATFPAGDLEQYDRIHVYSEASAGGSGSSSRSCRLSVTSNGVETAVGNASVTAAGPLFAKAEFWILSDTSIGVRSNVNGQYLERQLSVSSLGQYGLTVSVEYWTSDATDPIFGRVCRIIPVKPGMMHLPLR